MAEEETNTLRFFACERFFVERLISIIYRICKRDDIGAEELRFLAILLRATERLPMVTDSVAIKLALINEERNGDWGYFSLFLCHEELELSVGERIDHGVGADHQELNNLRIGLSWRGTDAVETCWEDWLDDFSCRANDEQIRISIEDHDSDIDWNTSKSGAEFWDYLK